MMPDCKDIDCPGKDLGYCPQATMMKSQRGNDWTLAAWVAYDDEIARIQKVCIFPEEISEARENAPDFKQTIKKSTIDCVELGCWHAEVGYCPIAKMVENRPDQSEYIKEMGKTFLPSCQHEAELKNALKGK